MARPLFIWEPVPDLCIPAEQANTFEAISYVDVVSPNHAELAGIFNVPAATASGNVDRSSVEMCSQKWLEAVKSTKRNLHVIVRAGKDGCCVVSNNSNGEPHWLPAYHANSSDRVVDPTGGGNGFLGGFAVGLLRKGDPVEAAIWGSVSASFCIEQVGMPVLQDPDGDNFEERWNGTVVTDRLNEFRTLCGR